jgi:hypothetical protein
MRKGDVLRGSFQGWALVKAREPLFVDRVEQRVLLFFFSCWKSRTQGSTGGSCKQRVSPLVSGVFDMRTLH